jgi:thioesterase domain-containing protein
LRDQAIERLFLPFVALRQLGEAARAADTVPSSLREVITAGEQLQVTPEIRWLFDQLDGCRLQNQYGPTESHVVTAFTMPGRPQYWTILPPIGRPIANAEIHILDRRLQPVPIGVIGEILIGGAPLARGYFGRPDLTAERFITDPFSRRPSAKLYKSGDLARYSPDGNIQYLGRNDGQVKIRGFRVELGEIEAALSSHSSVRQAVVAPVGGESRDLRLVAYVTTTSGQSIDVRDLKLYLGAKLPAYMVPTNFVRLAAFPLTPSGKLDRKALRFEEYVAMHADANCLEPRSNVEIVMADILARVLSLQKVGIRDDFFDLGGHSLTAVRAVNSINRTLHLNLGVATLVQHRTIERLAASVAQSEQSVVFRMADGESGPPVYVVYAGLHQFQIARFLGGKRPIFGIDVPMRSAWCAAAAENRRSALPTVEQFVEPYLDALRAHAGSSSCILLGHCFAGLVAFELARRFQEVGGAVEKVILLDSAYAVVGPFPVARQQWRRYWQDAAKAFAAGRASNAILPLLKDSWLTLRWLLRQIAGRGWDGLKERFASPQRLMTGMRDEGGKFIEFPTLVRMYENIYKTYVPRRLETAGILVKAEPATGGEKPYRDFDSALGWGHMFAEGLDIIQVKGNHISMIEVDHNMAGLAKAVNAVLERDVAKPSLRTNEKAAEPKKLSMVS